MTLVCDACGKLLAPNPDEEARHFRIRRNCDRACGVKSAVASRIKNNATGAKLSIQQVSEIKAALAQGRNMRDIAQAFGVVYQTIWSIQKGRTWRRIR